MSVIDDFLKKNEDEAEQWLRTISDMSTDPAYEYAGNFLDSLYDNVADEGRITEAQKQAVLNIQAKPSEFYGRHY